MYFSGKITNSILTYVRDTGWDAELLFEMSDLPSEFLKDSSCWLDAEEIEKFLKRVETSYSHQLPRQSIITQVGHSCFELNAWGVLDSVLKMMQQPHEVYSQPHRFISYFVSPAPPIGNFIKDKNSIAFDVPISNQEFPYVTEYLRSALEALPKYLGKEMASAKWKNSKIQVSWSDSQKSLLVDDKEKNFNPELMQNLVLSLENTQRELEEKKKEITLKSIEIKQLKKTPSRSGRSQLRLNIFNEDQDQLHQSMDELKHHVLRLSEYLGRAQQLVTLLVGQERDSKPVREAMRRVDWEYVQKNYKNFVEQAIGHLKTIQLQVPKQQIEMNSKPHLQTDQENQIAKN